MNVDLDELTGAFEDASPVLNYFVDLHTGEIVLVSETLGFIEAGQQRFEMNLSPGRFLAVPVEGATVYEDDLEAFLDRVDDDALVNDLENALDDPDPAKRIDAILSQHEEIAADWKRFRRARIRERALEWMGKHRLEAGAG